MNVSLTPELEQLVSEKVATGMYQSASEVIREALRLLKERDEIHEHRVAELRREISIGLEQLRRGEGIPGEQVFEELRQRSQERRHNQG
jgi:antitoxin ParD1/3/4